MDAGKWWGNRLEVRGGELMMWPSADLLCGLGRSRREASSTEHV